MGHATNNHLGDAAARCSPALDALDALEQEQAKLEQEHARAMQLLEHQHREALALAGGVEDGSEAVERLKREQVERLKREQGRERSTLEEVFRWERHFLRQDVRTKPRSVCG